MNSQDLTTMKDIGKLIRDIRKQQGVTQEELAGISGTGRKTLKLPNDKLQNNEMNFCKIIK